MSSVLSLFRPPSQSSPGDVWWISLRSTQVGQCPPFVDEGNEAQACSLGLWISSVADPGHSWVDEGLRVCSELGETTALTSGHKRRPLEPSVHLNTLGFPTPARACCSWLSPCSHVTCPSNCSRQETGPAMNAAVRTNYLPFPLPPGQILSSFNTHHPSTTQVIL